jgi:hypothetical protein
MDHVCIQLGDDQTAGSRWGSSDALAGRSALPSTMTLLAETIIVPRWAARTMRRGAPHPGHQWERGGFVAC